MTTRASKINARNPPTGTDVFTELRYVWLFHCSNRPGLHAATLDRRGQNVPKCICQSGTWKASGQLIVGPDSGSRAATNIEALKAGIIKDGFYLWTVDAEPLPDTLRLMR
jgi:hypothetical protein